GVSYPNGTAAGIERLPFSFRNLDARGDGPAARIAQRGEKIFPGGEGRPRTIVGNISGDDPRGDTACAKGKLPLPMPLTRGFSDGREPLDTARRGKMEQFDVVLAVHQTVRLLR